jgi:hypothetical protein
MGRAGNRRLTYLPLDKGMVRMQSSSPSKYMKDNGGRRRMTERRQYAGSSYFPERRGTRFRRSGSDRRWHPAAVISVDNEKRKAFDRTQKNGPSS